MMDDWVIETRGLSKTYGEGNKVRALDDVSIRIGRGEFVSVMGPSGSGKSTLLNMLGALDRPSAGLVLIDDRNLAEIRNLDRFRSRTVGFVFQMHNLIPTLNARENVEVPMMGQVRSSGERRKRTDELMALVGLSSRTHHLPSQLSGGQRQRVAIARALANRPSLILADEPTGNLDSQSGAEVIDLMRRLSEELGTTIIVVTHDLAVARQTRRVLLMLDGKIVDDHLVRDPFEEDLEAFRASGLGQALCRGDEEALRMFDPDAVKALQRVLVGEECVAGG
jgi:ABC-type lipoprotein export system ATPase subunit